MQSDFPQRQILLPDDILAFIIIELLGIQDIPLHPPPDLKIKEEHILADCRIRVLNFNRGAVEWANAILRAGHSLPVGGTVED